MQILVVVVYLCVFVLCVCVSVSGACQRCVQVSDLAKPLGGGGGCASCFVLVEFKTAKQESNNVVFFLLETLFLVNSVPVKRSEERSGLCFSFFKRGSR